MFSLSEYLSGAMLFHGRVLVNSCGLHIEIIDVLMLDTKYPSHVIASQMRTRISFQSSQMCRWCYSLYFLIFSQSNCHHLFTVVRKGTIILGMEVACVCLWVRESVVDDRRCTGRLMMNVTITKLFRFFQCQ